MSLERICIDMSRALTRQENEASGQSAVLGRHALTRVLDACLGPDALDRCLGPGDCVQARPILVAASAGSSQWPVADQLKGFFLIIPSPFTFEFSFGEPMYQMMPAPDTSPLSPSLALTVTWPAPCTVTLARLAFSLPALSMPAPLMSIVRSSTRPDKLAPSAPSTD